MTNSEQKPSREQWDIAEYLIKAINSPWGEPFNKMAWAKDIQAINGTYSIDEIKAGIDWLFSNQGAWFRKNVQDSYGLRKHFKTIHEKKWLEEK